RLDTRGYTATSPIVVFLYGLFFGTNDQLTGYGAGEVRYGPGYTARCSITKSNVSVIEYSSTQCSVDMMTCQPAPGIGANHQWNVTVGGQTSDMSADTTSYKRPVILTMPDYQWPFSDTAGGDAVTIFGDQFGPANFQSPYDPISAFYGSEL